MNAPSGEEAGGGMRGIGSQSGSAVMNALWALAGLAAIYFGIMYVPAYWDHLDVKQAMRQAANMAVTDFNDDRLKDFISEKCRGIRTKTVERYGQPVNVPIIDVAPEEVSITRNDSMRTIEIELTYERVVNYPFTDQQRTLVFATTVEGDLTPVKW